MENVIKGIKDILKDDKEHILKFVIEYNRFMVQLIYDPSVTGTRSEVIPIVYSVPNGFCTIDDKLYRELFWPMGLGIDSDEVGLIKKVMDYIEEHSADIDEMCDGLHIYDRNASSETVNNDEQ